MRRPMMSCGPSLGIALKPLTLSRWLASAVPIAAGEGPDSLTWPLNDSMFV